MTYPGAFDNLPTKGELGQRIGYRSRSEPEHADDLNAIARAVERIQAVLGLHPEGLYPTVGDRIAGAEAGSPGGDPLTPFDFGVQYVHPDGSDASNGLSPYAPKATMEAAYGDLPSTGGTIILAQAQRHDVGDGLDFDRRKPAVIKALGRPRYNRGLAPVPNATIYTSTEAATMLTWDTPASFFNAYGFGFENVDFEVSEGTTTVMDANGVNEVTVENCGFLHAPDDATQAHFVAINAYHDDIQGNDSSWWRVRNCYSRGGRLVHGVGFGLNQWVIRDNVCFGQNISGPFIYMENGHRLTIWDNNLEGGGASAGVHLKSTHSSRVGNSGEATDPMVILESCYSNLVQDMGIVGVVAINKRLVRLTGTSANNFIINTVVGQFGNLYTDGIDDQTNNAGNWILQPSSNKDRTRIALPGLRIAGVELTDTVKGKAGDLGVKATSADPPFLYYKTSDDVGTSGWRKVSLGDPDSGGAGKRLILGPNSVA